jgi:hypothetical protein
MKGRLFSNAAIAWKDLAGGPVHSCIENPCFTSWQTLLCLFQLRL